MDILTGTASSPPIANDRMTALWSIGQWYSDGASSSLGRWPINFFTVENKLSINDAINGGPGELHVAHVDTDEKLRLTARWHHYAITWRPLVIFGVNRMAVALRFDDRLKTDYPPTGIGIPYSGGASVSAEESWLEFDTPLLDRATEYGWDPAGEARFTLGSLPYGVPVSTTTLGARGDAHATFDEMSIYAARKASADLDQMYRDGRFYKNGDAVFSSRPFIPSTSGTLWSVAWTQYLPAAIPGAAVEIRILVDDGTTLVTSPWLTAASGSPVGLGVQSGSVVRYEARFVDTADEFAIPFLESPILDDVLLTFLPGTGRLSSWQEP